MRKAPLLVLATVFALAGCTASITSSEPAAVDLAAERASLMAADAAWFEAYSGSDDPVAVFVDNMVDDGAQLLPPDAPLAVGKEAIRTVIATLEALPGFEVQWQATGADVGAGGNLGYTVGTYEMHLPGAEGQMLRSQGKYVTIWRKQADGAWKVEVDMFNADGPPTAIEE